MSPFMVAALSLGVSPLATLPAAAQQDTQKTGQTQSGSQSNTQSGSSATGQSTGTDCKPDASGACPPGVTAETRSRGRCNF